MFDYKVRMVPVYINASGEVLYNVQYKKFFFWYTFKENVYGYYINKACSKHNAERIAKELKESYSNKEIRTYSEENTKNKINNIMNNFDFKRVAETMKFLDWKWKINDGCMRIPTEEDLRNSVNENLLELAEKEKEGHIYWYISTGGFDYSFSYEDDEPVYTVKFYVEDWEE